jgi:beta-barrel assembly-enhancing protease
MTYASRRRFLAGTACGCLFGFGSRAVDAKAAPAQLVPLVPPDYEPKDKDERGLWQDCDKLERELVASDLLIRDPALSAYLRSVAQGLLGEHKADLRVYAVRNPEFNASMLPNGMMLVHSGLLARARNEAQLAAVIGHECGHYLRLHSIRRWRDLRGKSAVAAFISVAGGAAAGVAGGSASWYDLANAISTGLMLSVFTFSREQESEADLYGIKLLRQTGYAPHAASEIWSQLIEERKASAAARNKKYKDGAASALSTHPPTSERMFALKAAAMEMEGRAPAGTAQETRREEYLAAIAPLRRTLIDEQIRLNDPGASLYLVNSLAQDGWNGVLRYNEGEVYRLRDEDGDAQRAADAYAAAVAYGDAPPEAHRAHGYALIKSGRIPEGRQALEQYLILEPDASDAEMVRFTLSQ